MLKSISCRLSLMGGGVNPPKVAVLLGYVRAGRSCDFSAIVSRPLVLSCRHVFSSEDI